MRQARFKGNRGVYKCQTLGTLQFKKLSIEILNYFSYYFFLKYLYIYIIELS